MKRINLIFGTGDFADILYEKLCDDKIPIEAFTVDRKFINGSASTEKEVIPYEEIRQRYPDHRIFIYIGVISNHNMFEGREQLFRRLTEDGYHTPNYISPSAYVRTRHIGQGNIIMENVVIESHCSIQDGNLIWPNVVLPHHNQVGSFNNISPSVSFSGYASIGDRCFIGNNAVLNNHAVVHDRALVGAGAFVRHELGEEQVLVPTQSYVLEGRKSYEFK